MFLSAQRSILVGCKNWTASGNNIKMHATYAMLHAATLLVCCQFCKRKSRIRRVGPTTLSERAKMQNAQRTKMIANQIGKYNYQVDWPDLPVQWSSSLAVWQSGSLFGLAGILIEFSGVLLAAFSLQFHWRLANNFQKFPIMILRCEMRSSCSDIDWVKLTLTDVWLIDDHRLRRWQRTIAARFANLWKQAWNE